MQFVLCPMVLRERTENRGVVFSFSSRGAQKMNSFGHFLIILKILDFGEFEADFHEM